MKKTFFVLSLVVALTVSSQDHPGTVHVKYIENGIVMDGKLEEPEWQTAESAANFWQFFPTDSVRAGKYTEVKVLYDDENIYVGVYAESTSEDNG